MSEETKAPTMEEVEQKGATVALGLVIGAGQAKRQAAFDALKWMRDAALLGVQVPGLHKTLDALDVERDSAHDEMPPDWPLDVTERVRRLGAKVSALQARVKEVEDEHTAHVWKTTEHVRALEARVKELERERDEVRLSLGYRETEAMLAQAEGDKARSERDALRAQVDAVSDIASAVVMSGEGEAQEAVAHRILSALSVPPAETVATSNGVGPVLYVLEVHVGDGDWEPAFLGTHASMVREKVDVKDRSMGPTRVAEYVRRALAETTPATERAGQLPRAPKCGKCGHVWMEHLGGPGRSGCRPGCDCVGYVGQ